MLEYKGILTSEQDIAGKWRVLVDCGAENLSLKFQSYPTDDDVRAVALPVINRRNAEMTAEMAAKPTPEVDAAERMALENKYLEATKQLCELAGDDIPTGTWPKLEDVDFEAKAAIASEVNPGFASLLMTTLTYTYFQLKLMGWQWEQIEHREVMQ